MTIERSQAQCCCCGGVPLLLVAQGSTTLAAGQDADIFLVAHVAGRVYQMFTWVGAAPADQPYGNYVPNAAPGVQSVTWRLEDAGTGSVKGYAKNWTSATRTLHWALMAVQAT